MGVWGGGGILVVVPFFVEGRGVVGVLGGQVSEGLGGFRWRDKWGEDWGMEETEEIV